VWEALLEDMPVMATIRQLPKLTSVGVLKPGKWEAVDLVCERLKGVKGAKVHPLQILFALKTYSSGHGFRGKLTWNPVEQVVEALEEAFYLSFGNVEPTGKTIVIGLDVSASMDGSRIAGTNITAREAATAMAMVTAAVEPRIVTLAFTTQLIQFRIKPRSSLESVISEVSRLPFGGTDCALPILGAMEQEIPVDTFIVYTDSETWAGRIHPAQALKQYRNKWNNNAKSIVVGMTSNGFSIADPNDAGMLDVVGFDTSVPQVMSDFISA
jgi:60 kDa SS-A/Ro ribonucleoprotein